MVIHRPPQRLEEFAFYSWLKALDSGVSIPKEAPTTLLLRALAYGAKLRESTVVRVVQAAACAGVEELKIEGEIINPTLLQQLARALTVQPSKLQKISFDLSPRLHKKSIYLLINSLRLMCNLTEVRLTGGANDELLEALSSADSPLHSLDLSYSPGVTDNGLKSLIRFNNPVAESSDGMLREARVTNLLKHLNIWETNVTTRGCMWALEGFKSLATLSCQWTLEAIVLLFLKQHDTLNLEQLLICESELNENVLISLTKLCPNIKYLTVRRPKAITLSFNVILSAMPLLQDFTVFQFSPYPTLSLPIPSMSCLQKLILSSLYAETICLDAVLQSCPSLCHLTLEGLKPRLSDTKSNTNIFVYLKELRINTTFTLEKSLEPSLIVKILKTMTRQLSLLDLGCCKHFEDSHFLEMLEDGSLNEIVDLRLSGASNVSNTLLYDLMDGCPDLRRVVLKMVTKERLAQLESMKVELRINNLDFELITYGHRV